MVEKQQIDIKQISIRQVGAVKTILAKSGFTFENGKRPKLREVYLPAITTFAAMIKNKDYGSN